VYGDRTIRRSRPFFNEWVLQPFRSEVMRDIVKSISRGIPALLLGCSLVATPAAAETTDKAAPQLKSMSQAEYEAYREQLQKQVEEAAVTAPQQDQAASESEAEKEQDKSEDSGYGRGYRSRTERGGRAGGGYRSGAMSRGGGRGR
jgi:hypothetical protein